MTVVGLRSAVPYTYCTRPLLDSLREVDEHSNLTARQALLVYMGLLQTAPAVHCVVVGQSPYANPE